MRKPLTLLLVVLMGVIFIASNVLADPGWGDEPEQKVPIFLPDPGLGDEPGDDPILNPVLCSDPGWGDDDEPK